MYLLHVKYTDCDDCAKHKYKTFQNANEWFDDILQRAKIRVEYMYITDPTIQFDIPLRSVGTLPEKAIV
jgi:hypothetical protein